jgi:hypothetical protein
VGPARRAGRASPAQLARPKDDDNNGNDNDDNGNGDDNDDGKDHGNHEDSTCSVSRNVASMTS